MRPTSIEALRIAEARARDIASARARAHQCFVRAVAELGGSHDPYVTRATQEERRDAIVVAHAAYELVVKAALEHDRLATRLIVAELEAVTDPTPEHVATLGRRRAELADIEGRTSKVRAA